MTSAGYVFLSDTKFSLDGGGKWAPGGQTGHNMITACLGDHGEIANIINNTGGATAIHPQVDRKLAYYP